MKLSGVLFLLVSFFAVPPLQSQGLLFIQQETRDGKSTTSRIQIEKNRMRAESSATGESTAFTFDGDRDIVRSINFDKKTYLELDQAQVKQIRQQLDQLEEKLKGMPAQRRAIVEKMIQGRGRGGALLGADLPPVEYRQAGSDKVAQWACTKYDGYRAKEKVMEVCTVDPKVFGLTPADFDVARQLADFMKNLIPQIADQAFVYGSLKEQGFNGIPVRRTTFVKGRAANVNEIKEFRRETFPASTWEVPSGFTRQTPGK